MTYKDLDIKKSYINQGIDNIVDKLINPALKCTKIYRRAAGFFSSTVLLTMLPSLGDFVKNNGKIQLIVSPNLNEDDIDTINKGYSTKEAILSKNCQDDFENELLNISDENLQILYELIVRDILDIKIACVKNKSGIYHDKLGILTDFNNNAIVFYGSPNSSISGYQENYEKIRVVKSWSESDYESVQDEIREFDTLWNDLNEYVSVLSFKESIKQSIIKIIEKRKLEKSEKPVELYDYQKEAISAWVQNNYRGFFVMATGTGKTWTALFASKELLDKNPCLLVIIAPYKHLIKQWSYDVKRIYKDSSVVLISSENSNWTSEVYNLMILSKYNKNNKIVLISTIKSFLSDKFKTLVNAFGGDKLLIVDEAHRFTNRPDFVKDNFKYLLGLSATPINGKSLGGGLELVNYFGGQVYNLPIEDALEKGFLVPYYYYPIYVNATDDEEESFKKISFKISQCFNGETLVDADKLNKLIRSRLRLMSMAAEKEERITEFIKQIKDKDHFIVYCGDGQIGDTKDEEIKHIQFVKNNLDSLGYKSSQFTASEDIKRRMELVEMFNSNEIDSLVAIRCLDEGINIPSIKSALILSSNDDYREFVQRRGRILRRYNNKTYASIYDVIVLPSIECPNMAKIELRRFYEYAKLSIQKDVLIEKLKILLKKYNLTIDEIMFYTELETESDLDE